MINTFLTYILVILPVIVGLFAINLHITTSKHNFDFETQKLRTNANSKWSMHWFDFAIIGLHLAFIAFINIYFLAGYHDDIIISTIVNSFALFFIYFFNIGFEIDMNSNVIARIKAIKI